MTADQINRPSVFDLVPAFCEDNSDPASASRLRMAFRARCMFFNEAGAAVQVDQLIRARVTDRERLVTFLCETYSRAVFETLFALHFDRADTTADALLLETIREAFGTTVAEAVHETVKARGVIIERGRRPSIEAEAEAEGGPAPRLCAPPPPQLHEGEPSAEQIEANRGKVEP